MKCIFCKGELEQVDEKFYRCKDCGKLLVKDFKEKKKKRQVGYITVGKNPKKFRRERLFEEDESMIGNMLADELVQFTKDGKVEKHSGTLRPKIRDGEVVGFYSDLDD